MLLSQQRCPLKNFKHGWKISYKTSKQMLLSQQRCPLKNSNMDGKYPIKPANIRKVMKWIQSQLWRLSYAQ
jgi:hypothetical protein